MENEEELYIAWTQTVSKRFIYFMSVTLLPMGLVLNSFQMAIFSRKKFYNTNIGFHFMVNCAVCESIDM